MTRKKYVILMFLLPFSLMAQNWSMSFDYFNNRQFDLALKYLKKQYKKQPEDVKSMYWYGRCILEADVDRKEAIPVLNALMKKDAMYKDVSYHLGLAYMYEHSYIQAKTMFLYFVEHYREIIPDKKEPDTYATKEAAYLALKHIETAEELIKRPVNVVFQNMGQKINTKRSEKMPFISLDEKTLFLTSNKKFDKEVMELINNVYKSKLTPYDEQFASSLSSVGKEVNSDEQDFLVGLSPLTQKIILRTEWGDGAGDIFVSSKTKSKYTDLIELEMTINSKYDEQAACFTQNEDTLFFSSNRPGGFGGYDLYYSIRISDDAWGTPVNLGATINTKYDESYPYLNRRGGVMHFASNRPESMGGFDVFKVERHKENTWSKPQNIGYPLNNTYDNYIMSYSDNKRYAYLSQIRPEGRGGEDVYRVIFTDVEASFVVYTGAIFKGSYSKKEKLSGNFSIKAYSLTSKGRQFFAESTYSEEGKYLFAFPPGTYVIEIEGDAFQTKKQKIFVPDITPEVTIHTKNFKVN